MPPQEKNRFEWDALEFLPRRRGRDWHIAVGIITISISLTALLMGNTLFAIVIVLGVSVYFLYISREPRHIRVALSERGVEVGEVFYPFSVLQSFSVSAHTERPKLIFRPESRWSSYLIAPVEGVAVEELHEFLLDFLPEEEHLESLGTRIMEYLGF